MYQEWMKKYDEIINGDNLVDEEKKAIEYWKRDIELYHYNTQLCSEHYAQIILNLIKKQEKVIDEMAISLMHNKNNKFNNMTLGEVEKHFYGKVEEDEFK